MAKASAGLLVWRPAADGPEFLLAHPGGPFWKSRDEGAWSIPKGLIEPGEEPLAAARREFREETSFEPEGPFDPLPQSSEIGCPDQVHVGVQDQVAQLLQVRLLLRAAAAGRHVLIHRERRQGIQFAIQGSADEYLNLIAVHDYFVPPSGMSSFNNNARARDSRDITVPIGTLRTYAISL